MYTKPNLTTNDEEGGWDGHFNQIPVDSGVYVYWIKEYDIAEAKIGTLTVLK